MRTVKLDWADVFMSDDIWRHEYSDADLGFLEDFLSQKFDIMLFEHLDSRISQYVDAVKRQSSKKKFGILHAHGGFDGGRRSWFYVDGSHRLNLQDWIDHNSLRYFCLILASCNCGSLTPSSDGTMLLLPDRPFGIWSASEGDVSWSLIHDNRDIDAYTVAHELSEFEERGATKARAKAAAKAKAKPTKAKHKKAKFKPKAKTKRKP